jgi:hypothetical protein
MFISRRPCQCPASFFNGSHAPGQGGQALADDLTALARQAVMLYE